MFTHEQTTGITGATVSEAPITRDEMIAMFGEQIPMEAVALIWNEPETTTIGQVRARLREIAAARKTPPLLDRLRSEAINWSATCGDLFGEAADTIEQLLAAIKNSDDAHWTPAMRAAMQKTEGRSS